MTSAPEEALERLRDDARAVLAAARTTARAYGSSGDAFRRLLIADVALARMALLRGVVYLLLCALMVGTAWALLTAIAVMALRAAGASWPVALLVPLLLSLAVAAAAWVKARRALRHADLDATRRQFGRLFVFAEPDATADATERSGTDRP